jgi:hypothetical protein
MFKAGAGNSPTLPVVAFFIFASGHYDAFYQLFNKVFSDSDPAIHPHWADIVARREIEEALIAYREIFNREPSLARRMLNQLDSPDSVFQDPTETENASRSDSHVPEQKQQTPEFLWTGRND